ncbi:MAG: hypothetical protein MUC63_04865 [Planctomycetes bacterium]|jgi:hypothetical protein|nr:hypothetical protein [Planctomycetota bacterium]
MRLALVLATVAMGIGGFFAADAQAGPGDRDEGRQGGRMEPRDARHPAPEVRQPAPEARKPEAQPRRPVPAAPEVRHATPDGRGWNRQAELARRQAEERRRAMEQAQALMRQADELVLQANGFEAARARILAQVQAMQAAARGRDRGRHLGWEKRGQPASRRLDVQAVNRLLEQAQALAAARERLLASAQALRAQAQALIARCGR